MNLDILLLVCGFAFNVCSIYLSCFFDSKEGLHSPRNYFSITLLNIWKIFVPHPGNQWPFWASITGPQLNTDCHISFLPTFRTKHVQRFPTWRASEPEQLWLWTLCARLKWFKWYHNWWSTIVAPQNQCWTLFFTLDRDGHGYTP